MYVVFYAGERARTKIMKVCQAACMHHNRPSLHEAACITCSQPLPGKEAWPAWLELPKRNAHLPGHAHRSARPLAPTATPSQRSPRGSSR